MTRTSIFQRLAAGASLAATVVLSGACSSGSTGSEQTPTLSDAGEAGETGSTPDTGDGYDALPACGAMQEGIAVVQATADLRAVASQLRVAVALACRTLALAGGKNVSWDDTSVPTDAELREGCELAAQGIRETGQDAGWSVDLVTPPRCHVDVAAFLSCAAPCPDGAACSDDPAVGCDPADLSVLCDGVCPVGASCEGANDRRVSCDGPCSGGCEGVCEGGCVGTCTGDCEGVCSKTDPRLGCVGTCSGTCTGTCTEPSVGASCRGSCAGSCTVTEAGTQCAERVRCAGGCEGAATQPMCDGVVRDVCAATSVCGAACAVGAQAKAVCSPPLIHVHFSGVVQPDMYAALQGKLPILGTVATVQAPNLLELLSAGLHPLFAWESVEACASEREVFDTAALTIAAAREASANVWTAARGR